MESGQAATFRSMATATSRAGGARSMNIEKTPEGTQVRSCVPMGQVIARMAIVVFVVEGLIMFIFKIAPPIENAVLEGFVDAFSLTVLTAPIAYFWIVRPLNRRLTSTINDLNRARIAALASGKAKAEFLANMSHEIRTPLNGVMGMLELLATTRLDEVQRRYVGGARTASDCLLSLLNDVLDFSKIEAGKIELDPIDFNLRTLLEDVAEVMAPAIHRKGLEIVCEIDADLPPMLMGDADRLRQVVLNLVGNAAKFTERGQVVIRARECPAESTDTLIRIEVADSGIGIPDDRRDRLFKLFSQVDASTTRRYGGTGLGLALCQRLVELFGGNIGVESTPGKGSTFWFTARLQPVTVPHDRVALPSNFKEVRVLVVDDNAINLEITSTHLQRWGISCDVADHGPAALIRLQEAWQDGRPYGLAIVDMQMPDMDGRELIQLIRQTPEIAGIPLIVLTSIGEVMSRDEANSCHVAACLHKPVRQSRLFDAVVAATSERRREAGVPLEEKSELACPRASWSECAVLVAEDNDLNQIVVRELLKTLGLTCTLASNGQQAVEHAASRAFDLVLMDCQMPLLDGFDATSKIRRREEIEGGWARNRCRLPVIALTANAIAGDREQCLAAGMDDYLTKPIDPKKLLAVLKRWLPESQSSLQNSGSSECPSYEPSARLLATADCFDRFDFLGRCFGNRELACNLLDLFVDRGALSLEAIDKGVADRDRDGLRAVVHTLKGVAGNLSAPALATLTAKIDHDFRDVNCDIDALLRDTLEVRRELERCLAAVPTLKQDIAEPVSS